MKTILLTFVALMVSAQTVEVEQYPFVPGEFLTKGHLNGRWWNQATPMEREIYRRAWNEATGQRTWLPGSVYSAGT
jgi:hypothetical protein